MGKAEIAWMKDENIMVAELRIENQKREKLALACRNGL